MAAEPVSIVTPHGVRDGDPAALSALTERRGWAVLAYTSEVAAPGRAVEAAADAFARFRGAVVLAADPHAVDPERTLLRGTRYAAAQEAPVEVPLRIRLRGRASPFPCALVPELLAARAERELSDADRGRLFRHLSRCAACRAAEERFRAGEHAYRDAPIDAPPAGAAREIMRALLAAAPRTGANGNGDGNAPALRAVEAPQPLPLDASPGDAAPLDPRAADPLHQATVEFDPLALANPLDQATVEFDALAFANEGRDADRFAPVLLPDDADADQPTYEFDALPAEAFELDSHEFDALGAEPFELDSVPIAPAPSRATRTLRIVLPLLILLALAVAALAVAGVLRA